MEKITTFLWFDGQAEQAEPSSRRARTGNRLPTLTAYCSGLTAGQASWTPPGVPQNNEPLNSSRW